MHLLILGGSQFLGRAIATQACVAGHNVTCAAFPEVATARHRLVWGGFVGTTSNRLLRFNWLILLEQAIAARGGRRLHAARTGRGEFCRE
jgi:hypothetical protein